MWNFAQTHEFRTRLASSRWLTSAPWQPVVFGKCLSHCL